MSFPVISAAEAAALVHHGNNVAFSGFTPAGAPKVVSRAIAERARAEHAEGRPFRIGVLTGASTGPSIDGVLAEADAVEFRTPYQSDKSMRHAINTGRTRFFDMHLSNVAYTVRTGVLGEIDMAIIEACDIDEDGGVVLTSGVGCAPTYARLAKRVVIELNRRHPKELRGFHDLYEPADPPVRREIPLYDVADRIGSEVLHIDPAKIVGVVETDVDDETGTFRECDDTTRRIGRNVAEFLAAEMAAGRIPPTFLPLQSGVGETANAVLEALGEHPAIPQYQVYTEVIQDAVIKQMLSGKVTFASGCSLSVSAAMREEIYQNLEFFRSRMVLRPQEISNSPELIKRLGLIACNTAIEADVFGNVNSTHILGRKMMNGIGGSADFTRNAHISIFVCPSTQRGNRISTIVPSVTHTDHSEHSVQVIITEWGVADLRGKAPAERARHVIEQCAHPQFRELLLEHVLQSGHVHTPIALDDAYTLHEQYAKTGDMRDAL